MLGSTGRLSAPCGRFAVLGNHDFYYGPQEVAASLQERGIIMLADEQHSFVHEQSTVAIVGIPDADAVRAQPRALLEGLFRRPTVVLAHDPVWFAHLPAGPYVMLAGHTHGGQVRLPGIGLLTNCSKAPLRWSHGLVVEDGRHLYVTGGIGTSGIPLRIGVPPEYAIIDLNGR